jgi:Domain of unknown function (DUF4259)
MSAWGSKIFQDDTALDFLGDLSGALEQILHDHLGKSKFRIDREIGPDVVAALACLRALAVGIDSLRCNLSRSEVNLWRVNYLRWYDKHGAKGWVTSKHAATYRRNVEREFEKLIAVSDEFSKDELAEKIALRDSLPSRWPKMRK